MLVPHLLTIKNKFKNQEIKETRDTSYIYKNELDKACFQHDIAYGDFKDLARRIASDKILRGKAFNIAKNPKYDGYQRGLASMVYNFFDKKPTRRGIDNNNNNNNNNNDNNNNNYYYYYYYYLNNIYLKVYSGFKDSIWGADLADMQLISKFSKRFRFLLCAIDIFGKYAWVILLKDKKSTSIVNAFQKILDISERKPNKIWVDEGSEFKKKKFEKLLKDNDIEMYWIHNEGKSVVAERFFRTLKNKIYK